MSSSYLRVHLQPLSSTIERHVGAYNPGEEVAGRVKLYLHKESKVNTIFVHFKGECKNQVGQGKNARHWQSVFFSLRQTLLHGPVRMQAGTYEYPFAFRFPGTFTFAGNPFTRNSPSFIQAPGRHPLPPSCSGSSGSGTYSVSYTILAVSERSLHKWSHIAIAYFAPCRTDANPDPVLVASKAGHRPFLHFKLGDDALPRALGTRESMKNAFHHSEDVSTVSFTLKAKAPTAIVAGRAYPVEVTLLVLSNKGNTDSMPDFRAKNFTLSLKAKTNIRVPHMFSDSVATIETQGLLGSDRTDTLLPPNTPKALNGLLSHPSTSSLTHIGAAPTFKSVAVSRSYVLELKATIVCLGEEHKFKVRWWNVTLYSARMEPGIEEAIMAIENIPVVVRDDGEDHEDDQPPSYEATQSEGERLPVYSA